LPDAPPVQGPGAPILDGKPSQALTIDGALAYRER